VRMARRAGMQQAASAITVIPEDIRRERRW